MSPYHLSQFRLYVLIGGVGSFASSVAFTLSQVYAIRSVHLDPLQLVLVGTVMEAVCFVAQVPTGILADLYSRRLAVIAGYLLMGGGLVLWGLVPTYWAILAANAIWSVGVVFTIGAEEAWASDEIAGEAAYADPEAGQRRVAAAFLRSGQAGQVGTFLGIPVAVGLAQAGLNVPLVVAAGLNLALGVALAVLMRERHFTPAPRSEITTFASMARQAADGVRAIRRSHVLAYVIGASFFIGLASEGFDRLSVAHFLDELHMPTALSPEMWIAVFAGVVALGSVVGTAAIGRRPELMQARAVTALLGIAQAICTAGMLFFGLIGQFWPAAIAYLVVKIVRSVQGPVFDVVLVANTASASRATVLSFDQQLDALGQVVGGPPAGAIGARTGAGLGVSTAGIFLLPAVGLFALAARRTRVVSGSHERAGEAATGEAGAAAVL